MINRGKRSADFEIFTKAFILAACFYFSACLIWQMAEPQIVAFWQMAKGWF